MIKLGIISGHHSSHKLTSLISQDEGIRLIESADTHKRAKELKTIDCLAEQDFQPDAILFDNYSPDFILLRRLIRERKTTYIRQIPRIRTKELEHLIKLQQEANVSAQLEIPLYNYPNNVLKLQDLKRPFLAKLNLAWESERLETQLIQFLLVLMKLDQSEVRKLDWMTPTEATDSNLLEIRLSFASGSGARVLLSNQIKSAKSGFDIYLPGEKTIRISTKQPDEKLNTAAIQNAIQHLKKPPLTQSTHLIGLEELLRAQKIHKILQRKINLTPPKFEGKK